MKIYNTLTKKLEHFMPKGKIGMYVCGPTVYDIGHLGHARSAVSFDLIRRYFLYKGFEVVFVSNYTDVDDKMIQRAQEEKITEAELAAKIIPEYEKDYGTLSVLPPTHQPRATQYIPQMVALVEKLIAKGVAYATVDGVYFEVSKFRDYGKLSGQRLSHLQAGARIAVNEKKKHAEDFALWKKAKPGEPKWPGPGGMEGRPGWHIECSAMSMDILGETFDIHGGGIDLQFPHHEDEIAQSEMASGKPFARLWLHNGHIKVNSEKMSKSLGNFFTIKDVLKKYHPAVVRYFLLGTHYRLPIDFSDDLLEQAKHSLERLRDFMRRLKKGTGSTAPDAFDDTSSLSAFQKGFELVMEDDFEISLALKAVFDLVRFVNAEMDRHPLTPKFLAAAVDVMKKIDSVLGVLEENHETDDDIMMLIEQRNAARKNKDFALSDGIRKELAERGIELEDFKDGTVWKRSLQP